MVGLSIGLLIEGNHDETNGRLLWLDNLLRRVERGLGTVLVSLWFCLSRTVVEAAPFFC